MNLQNIAPEERHKSPATAVIGRHEAISRLIYYRGISLVGFCPSGRDLLHLLSIKNEIILHLLPSFLQK